MVGVEFYFAGEVAVEKNKVAGAEHHANDLANEADVQAVVRGLGVVHGERAAPRLFSTEKKDCGGGTVTKKRTNDPWMPADEYGRRLPRFSVNLIVADVARAVAFYRNVLGAKAVYADVDFAAMDIAGLEFMLHADHTYDQHPWHARLLNTPQRGLGAELRLFGVSPDEVEARAKQHGARVLAPCTDKPHGWREVIVEDPDGYAWAVGVPTKKE